MGDRCAQPLRLQGPQWPPGQHEGVSKAFPIYQRPLHFLRSNFAKSALDILGASVATEEVTVGPTAGPFSA